MSNERIPEKKLAPMAHDPEGEFQSQSSFARIVKSTTPIPWMMSPEGERLAEKINRGFVDWKRTPI